MASLTERVLEYQRTGEGGEGIVEDVARRVYDFPRRACRWDEDASSDFFVAVFPKIRAMLDRFRDQGRPFESYLVAMLRFQLRSFAAARSREQLARHLAASPELWETRAAPAAAGVAAAGTAMLRGAGPAAAAPLRCAEGAGRTGGDAGWRRLSAGARALFGLDPSGTIRCAADRRRFLVACLKSAHLLADADVGAVARAAGMPAADVARAVDLLRGRYVDRLRRTELFAGRRNRAFWNLRTEQSRLAREVDPERRREIAERCERHRRTLRAAQKVLSRVRLGPSHRQIAEVLGMPKATVDSTVHRLKRRAAAVYAPGHEEYA